jgi:hypothetical protein
MYREPSPAAPKCALKNDPSAHARSSIRRRGAVRQVFPRAAGSSGGGPLRPSLPRATFPEDARHDDQAQTQAQSQRQTQSLDHDVILDAARNALLVTDYARRDAGSRLLRDALRHGQPGRRLRIPRESSLRFEIPSPPWSMNDFLSRASSGDDANAPQNSDDLPFTPRFAPAFAFRREGSGQPQSEPYHYSRPDGPVGERTRESRARPSRPRSRREEAGQQRPTIDGLGERLRSTSPEDERDDAWETLLTTITPDATLPSTDSSFTSAAALSTNPTRAPGSPRSAPSQPTGPQGPSATVHMILEPYPEYLNPCDFPDYATGSDTEPETDFDLRASGSRNRHRHRSRMFGIGSTQDSQPPIPTLSRTSTLPSISSLISQDPSSDVDMNAILDRLLHREDVPDEWWATAGLSRTIGRRLDLGSDSSNLTNDTPAREADET